MIVRTIEDKEVKAYKKVLSVEVEGKYYQASLYWDEQDGYTVIWYEGRKHIEEPESVAIRAESAGVPVGYLLEELEVEEEVNA